MSYSSTSSAIEGSRPWKYHNLVEYRKQSLQHGSEDCALILLNSPSLSLNLIETLWSSSSDQLVICADGAANRLKSLTDPEKSHKFIPQYIKGDLDSLSTEVKAYYKSKGTIIIQDYDQDYNDLEKCFILASEVLPDPVQATIYVAGAFGGRLDQEFACYHSLRRFESKFYEIVLINDDNIALFLSRNYRHRLTLSSRSQIYNPSIGLIPIYGPVESITTRGLKWNLSDGRLEFGKLVSTSNCLDDVSSDKDVFDDAQVTIVEIEASDDLIWTFEVS